MKLKLKLKIKTLILLLFAALIVWPVWPARGDGDGVGILPYYHGGDGDDPDTKVDGGGGVLGHSDLSSAAFGFVMTQDRNGHQTVTVFPVNARSFSWRRLAASLANSKACIGYKFAVGLIDARGRTTYVVTAWVDGGSGRAPLVRVQRF
ncbi:MAG: hypothetical protein U1E76_04695 [Planctomycetota bacterium]